jgi:nucleoside-diphosphate-sugar epimerase
VTRILVTGSSGSLGRALVARLGLDDDITVVAFDRRAPATLPANAQHRPGDVRDAPAVQRAMEGCDVVAHLAWIVGSVRNVQMRRDVDLGGTRNVLDAMHAVGCGRLVFASSATVYGTDPAHPRPYTEDEVLDPRQPSAYGAHKAMAEQMITAAGVPAALPRAAVIVGREVDNEVRRLFAAPAVVAVRGDDMRLQVVHTDDVARFFADACRSDRTGPVNLAPADIIGVDEAARLLGRRVVRLPSRVVSAFVSATWATRVGAISPGEFAAMRHLPLVDPTRLREEWGFHPAWSTVAALDDFRFALDRVGALGRFEWHRRTRARPRGGRRPAR